VTRVNSSGCLFIWEEEVDRASAIEEEREGGETVSGKKKSGGGGRFRKKHGGERILRRGRQSLGVGGAGRECNKEREEMKMK